jgi:predicted SprT family Zn-dependent metalloprotease
MSNLNDLQKECIEAIRKYVDIANKRWPQLNLAYPRILFNLQGRGLAGRASAGPNILELHNGYLLKDPEDYIPNTAGHEVAHVVARRVHFRRNIKSHGDEWQQVCWTFGIKAERCHRYNDAETPTQRRTSSDYKTENGIVRPVSVGHVITFD